MGDRTVFDEKRKGGEIKKNLGGGHRLVGGMPYRGGFGGGRSDSRVRGSTLIAPDLPRGRIGKPGEEPAARQGEG